MNRNGFSLRIYPDTVLRDQAAPVQEITEETALLIDQMADLMYAHQGIGLAAPQVGLLRRIVVLDIGEGLLPVINPEILDREGSESLEEGCLSLPDIRVEIQRPLNLTFTGYSPQGKEIRRDIEGLTARVLLHEIDHLNGRLIIDYVSPVRKALLKRQLQKLTED